MKKPDTKTLTTQIITDNALGSFLNYMPNPDDIVPGTFSAYDTYRQMRADPRIKSLLNKLKTAALNFPIHITQPEGCPDNVFAFVKGFDLWGKTYQKLKRVYSGLDYGFSVSELVWRYEDGLYIPDNIITRKPERFVFDRNWKLYLNDFGARKPLDQPYKWLEYHHDTDDENPYGTSVLRCVYWPYMFKKAGYEFWLQATEKFSVKTILAIFKADGDDNKIRETARLIAEQLLSITSGSAAAVGNVDSIHEVGMSGDLVGFASLVDACDTQISYGLTGQTIATSKTEGGSLALGEVQADLFYEDAKGIALEGQALIQKIINWAVELNGYGNTVPPLAEVDTERKASFEQVMKAIEHGVAVSRDAMYDRYGLPRPRDEDDTFVKETTEGFALSDSERPASGKKKALDTDYVALERSRLAELDSLANAAQKRISARIANTLSNYFNSLSTTETPPTKEHLENPYLPDVDPDFVRETQTLIAAALLLGMDHASRKLGAADEEIPPLPFEEAVSFMKNRIPMTKAEWNVLEPKLRFRAFTVARLTQLDYIESARSRLVSALEKGEGYASTWKDIKAIATEDGALNFKPGYWENVYRTNTQTAYTAGKLMQFKDNPPPAWRLLIVDDDRTSDICRGLMRDGKQSLTMASDHPFWTSFGFPPYHYQCRTGLQAVYKSEIGQGTTVENPSMKSLKKQFKPMDGFGGNPLDKESWWKITDAMIERAIKYGIWPDILQQAADLDMISYQKELLKGYVHVYDGKNGGYVQKAKNWEYSQREMNAAKELANEGHKIYLLPRSQKFKSPDMLIDNNIGEIKHQEKPTASSISSELKKAGKIQRARVVIIYALEETSFTDIQFGLWNEIHRTPVQTVILKWRGKTWELPRNILMNKNWGLK